MADFTQLAICVLLALLLSVSDIDAQPLSEEDVVSLLPEIPKTTNETLAAIVQDVVVQDAVQSIVGNGTLSGLVIKKNTVILPASEPDVILTQNEQILTAPVDHLEDIRKNITEAATVAAENDNADITAVEEISLAEVIPIDDARGSNTTPDKAFENFPEDLAENLVDEKVLSDSKSIPTHELPQISPLSSDGKKWKVPGIEQSDIKLPEGVVPPTISLPGVIGDKISAPLVAVLHPKNVTADFHNGSIIALLPVSTEKISDVHQDEEIVEYGARIPVEVIKKEKEEHPTVRIEDQSALEFQNVNAALQVQPSKDLVAVFALADESLYYENNENDMVPAEDIIFRPLFRYRQQENERTRILEERAYRKTNYRRYRPPYSGGSFGRNNNYNPYKRPRYYDDY